MKRVRILIYGKVQGVFFRANTKNKAKELGLKGWIRNKENDTVEILAEGEDDKINELIEWCKKGPDFARVDDLKVYEEEFTEKLSGFEIRY